MTSAKKDGYSYIPVEWFLGDQGSLGDFNREDDWHSGDFDPQLARLFLEYIQIGLTDRQACMEVPMNEKWPRSWGRGFCGAPDDYIHALNTFAKPMQFDVMAADVIDIADGTDALACENDIIGAIYNPLREALNKSVTKNVVMYRKMVGDRVASRKWWVSKMKPSSYGDKVQIDHGNVGGKPFKHVEFKDLTVEQLEKLAELDKELNKDDTGTSS